MRDPQKMTEQELAAYYQAHKDDPGEWEDAAPPVPKGKRVRLSATITVRFTTDEAAIIRHTAEVNNSTYSEVIRDAVRRLSQPDFAITPTAYTVVFNPLRSTETAARESEFTSSHGSQLPVTGRSGNSQTIAVLASGSPPLG